MTWKMRMTWVGFGLYTALVGGVSGAVGYKIGHIQGQQDAHEETRCSNLLDRMRDEFVKTCENSDYRTYQNGDLTSIVRKREQLEDLNECRTLEEWKCEPTVPSNLPKSEFRAKFYSK